jgi:hypothetical protein
MHPTDVPKPGKNNTTLMLLAGGTAVILGGWYFMQQDDPHQARLKDQAEMERKAKEAKEAGKATAHDAVREGEANYEATKVRVHKRLYLHCLNDYV